MDTRLLKFFIAVYEQKNLTRAAEQCFVSQPNISNGIKQLEEELQQQLFVRHKRGVEINTEAHQLYPKAKRILGEITSLSSTFKKKDFNHKITIGVTESLPQEHKQQFFRTAASLSDSVTWDIRGINRDCEVNLLVREWKYEDELFLPLWKEDYVLCIPDGHHLLSKKMIDINIDLANEKFIHCPPCEAHQQCLSILNNSENAMTTIGNCSTKTETLTLLMAGLGVTFLPESFIDGWYGFETRPYSGPKYYREIGLSYARKSLKNKAIARIIEYFSKNPLKVKRFNEFGYYTK